MCFPALMPTAQPYDKPVWIMALGEPPGPTSPDRSYPLDLIRYQIKTLLYRDGRGGRTFQGWMGPWGKKWTPAQTLCLRVHGGAMGLKDGLYWRPFPTLIALIP